ncbi:hypothetical protein F511_30574 [Dorcoceras hygrometricum]|uniref:CBS domain-containing protein n=1 Tax=Dorcoceras hygrometricum TaxID=472368 RepID=A0A2Z7AG32_9LAMI|nr:hypothetical protein F511_30574 [Dorcoceras hygrometricum]
MMSASSPESLFLPSFRPTPPRATVCSPTFSWTHSGCSLRSLVSKNYFGGTALEILVERWINGFPVIDDDWKWMHSVLKDKEFPTLPSGTGRSGTDMFSEVEIAWKTFNVVHILLSKSGRVVGDLMTPAPLVVREATNLEDAARLDAKVLQMYLAFKIRLLLRTKYRRLPVVDRDGKLVGIITRGNVVRAALQVKQDEENA